MNKNVKVALPGEWALEKTLGPTLEEIGVDLVTLYRGAKTGVSKIAFVAKRKISEGSENQKANLRVARDTFWNGAYSEENICAEYFGGVLADSRSDDGRDDSGIFYLDIIKSLSASQLHLHYIIYYCLNKLLSADNSENEINVGHSKDLSKLKLYLRTDQIAILRIKPVLDFVALHSMGLIGDYEMQPITINQDGQDVNAHMSWAQPTTLGIQLFSVAYAQLSTWNSFPKIQYAPFPDIVLPNNFAFGHEALFAQK